MELHILLNDIKSNVEGLLSVNTSNIWSVYGGLKRITSSIENILLHRLKYTQGPNKASSLDYLNFVRSLHWLNATLIPSADKIKSLAAKENINDGQAWIRLSLLSHTLSTQLRTLVQDRHTLSTCYYVDAFLCDTEYFNSLCLCLQALEQNNPTLLTDINHSLLRKQSERKPPSADLQLNRAFFSETNLSIDPLSENIVTSSVKLRRQESSLSYSTIQSDSRPSLTLPFSPSSIPIDDILACDEDMIDSARNPSQNLSSESNTKPQGKGKQKKGHTRSKSEMSSLKKQSASTLSFRSPDKVDGVLSSSLPGGNEEMEERIKNATLLQEGKRPNLHEGHFPQPRQGETLKSFLSSQDFETCAELDRENAHFAISEAIIAAIEYMKWNQVLRPADPLQHDLISAEGSEMESDEEIIRLKAKIQERKKLKSLKKQSSIPMSGSSVSALSSHGDSIRDSDSWFSTEDDFDTTFSDTDSLRTLKDGVKSDRFSYDSGALNLSTGAISAERVALSLLSQFNEYHLPKADELTWLVSESDAPQALLPLPRSNPVNPDDMFEGRSGTRIRGNAEWAPPRSQIIFNLHPQAKRSTIVARQNYRCAGCGNRVEPASIKRLRYCEYLGKYFCNCCHTNKLSVIPARVLQKWDVNKYQVSNFSNELIQRISDDPLFNIEDINPALMGRSKTLQRCTTYRLQLKYLRLFISTCRHADQLYEGMLQLPSYIIDDAYTYTLNDLLKIKERHLDRTLSAAVIPMINHVLSCPLCQVKGFICEICNKEDDVIFPFQLSRVSRCSKCQSCYHEKCFNKQNSGCPKCHRQHLRKLALQHNDDDA